MSGKVPIWQVKGLGLDSWYQKQTNIVYIEGGKALYIPTCLLATNSG